MPPTPIHTPTPQPTVRPELAGLSQLVVDAVLALPAKLDFATDGLSDEEIEVLEWADSRLFQQREFPGRQLRSG